MNQDYKNKIGWCYYCDQGWALIMKSTKEKKLVIWCDECDTIWQSPADFKSKNPDPDFKFEPGEFLVNPEDEEIEKVGWDKFIIENY